MPTLQNLLSQGNSNQPPTGAPPVGAPPVGAPPVGAPPVGAPPVGAPPVGAPNAPQVLPGASADTKNKPNRDMRTKVTGADKRTLQDMSMKSMSLLHTPEITQKLKRLLGKGEDIALVIADIADDVMLQIDDMAPNGLPLGVLSVITIMVLIEISKMVNAATGKKVDKSVLKLALVRTLESVVGKKKLENLNKAGQLAPNAPPKGVMGSLV